MPLIQVELAMVCVWTNVMIAHDRGRSSVRDCSGMFIVVKDAVASMNCLGTLLEIFFIDDTAFVRTYLNSKWEE